MYLEKESEVRNSFPHVTLLVNPEYEPKHLGSMVLESRQAKYASTDNRNIWISEDRSFVQVSISALGHWHK